MENKKCSSCCEVKSVTEFHKNKKKKDGYHNQCKKCRHEYNLKNSENKKEYNKVYYGYNKEKINKVSGKYRENNKVRISELNKKYQKENKEKIKLNRLDWKEKNKSKIKEYQKIWRNENKEYILNYSKKYRNEYRGKINEYFNIKYKNDPIFKLKQNIRNRIRETIKQNGFTKKSKTYQILGCSFEQFKLHLESKFELWMTWDNYGLYNGEFNYGWDIDHIIPTSSANTEEDVIKLNHYSNLQPLCSKVNRDIKRNNIQY
jgi:hypothetical protein